MVFNQMGPCLRLFVKRNRAGKSPKSTDPGLTSMHYQVPCQTAVRHFNFKALVQMVEGAGGLRLLLLQILQTQQICSFRMVTRSDQKIKELNDEEHQLFMQLEEVPCENHTRRRVLDTEASKVTAAQAAAETSHAYATRQALGIMGGAD
ncbi:hypothetical protein MTO96_044987 [Rhipicephalus appendiculatus]